MRAKGYRALVKIIKHKNGKAYVQVTRSKRLDNGRMTTEVIRSFGPRTELTIKLAEEFAYDFNRHLFEGGAPHLYWIRKGKLVE